MDPQKQAALMQDSVERLCVAVDELQDRIVDLRGDPDAEDQPLITAGRNYPAQNIRLLPRRVLKGHFGKIYAMHWAQDSLKLVSASQDGKLIVWNGLTTNKVHAVPLKSSWVMTCAFSEESSSLVACGGLDNLCSVYKLTDSDPTSAGRRTSSPIELAQHEGYLSCCRFIGENEIVTSSGDSTLILWDLNSKTPKHTFNDHTSDVMSVSVYGNKDTFVSGSCDSTAKLWDYRVKISCVKTFPGHESDINSVKMFPDGNALGTGSDDSTCRLFDIRAYRQLNRYASDKILCGITSVDFSHSGKWLFAGYDDYHCYAWNTVLGQRSQDMHNHENRVSCLGVSPDGAALCTGSWDTFLKIWA